MLLIAYVPGDMRACAPGAVTSCINSFIFFKGSTPAVYREFAIKAIIIYLS